jgi:hypothetical protein
VNRIRFDRYAVVGPPGEPIPGGTDLVVPVVDGVPLFEHVIDRWPGLSTERVVPPSTHWLGRPDPQLTEDGRAVVLDGECGEAGCCGVFARVTVRDTSVRWDDFAARGRPRLPIGLAFDFDRQAYEEALSGVASMAPVEWVALSD